MLKTGGRLCIITFHSIEDRIVKNAFTEAQGKCICPKDLPYCVCNYKEKSKGKIINKNPIIATHEEQERNSRAKSAKLRIFERIVDIINRKYYNKMIDENSRKKVFAALMRLGYGYSDIRQAMSEFSDDEYYEE